MISRLDNIINDFSRNRIKTTVQTLLGETLSGESDEFFEK